MHFLLSFRPFCRSVREVVALMRDDARARGKDSSCAYLEREVNQERMGFISDIAREIGKQIVANIYQLSGTTSWWYTVRL